LELLWRRENPRESACRGRALYNNESSLFFQQLKAVPFEKPDQFAEFHNRRESFIGTCRPTRPPERASLLSTRIATRLNQNYLPASTPDAHTHSGRLVRIRVDFNTEPFSLWNFDRQKKIRARVLLTLRVTIDYLSLVISWLRTVVEASPDPQANRQ
jgi:hypothetical protein